MKSLKKTNHIIKFITAMIAIMIAVLPQVIQLLQEYKTITLILSILLLILTQSFDQLSTESRVIRAEELKEEEIHKDCQSNNQ
ncbi:hypothetical protein [Methanobrevibacter filiformis]|uniref:Uncharacterized protein n=1 Tax=Methanobrevibacter filiformis TaxID=55758 RepID=A0A166FFX0_9EURY|nr:hypothetical protein [Methanobrevibacter filiformis]KZX17634.1 hypothetical protein MBFIL_00210 [Methanobrevibacter filiformis]